MGIDPHIAAGRPSYSLVGVARVRIWRKWTTDCTTYQGTPDEQQTKKVLRSVACLIQEEEAEVVPRFGEGGHLAVDLLQQAPSTRLQQPTKDISYMSNAGTSRVYIRADAY